MPSKGQPAYIEEEDEAGRTVRRTAAKKNLKVQIKTGSNERQSSQKGIEGISSDSRRANASGSSPPSKRVESRKTSKEERRMSSSSTTSPKKSPSKPPSVHQNPKFHYDDKPTRSYAPTQPILIQNPSHQLRAITQSHARPLSFHEGMYNAYPPISNSAFYIPPNNSLIPAPSYPPPSPVGSFVTYANGPTYHSNNRSAVPPAFRQDYSTPPPQLPIRTLEERLGGDANTRRRSSIYYNAGDHDDRGYDSAYERSVPIPRKSSLRKTKEQLDRERMPPPAPRSSFKYVDNDSLELLESRSRQTYRDERSTSRPRRPSMNRHSATYTYGTSNDVRIEPERSGGRSRRNSYYGGIPPMAPAPGNYEEKFKAAENYQTSVGGPTPRLTAETLKKASRRAHPASSQSTRSSGSRDESERQRSSVTTRTTGTTRTGAGDEDITIKLKGQGKIKIAGAEIDYDKDTELNIRRTGNVGGGGSQRSSDFGTSDDRRDRRERASDRSRLSSRMRPSREKQYI